MITTHQVRDILSNCDGVERITDLLNDRHYAPVPEDSEAQTIILARSVVEGHDSLHDAQTVLTTAQQQLRLAEEAVAKAMAVAAERRAALIAWVS